MRYTHLILCLFLLSCTTQPTVTISDTPPWYSPSVLRIEPGTTVIWENMGAVVHPVNTLSAPEPFTSGHFTTTYEHTFTTPGIYHYYCPIHPYMQGFIGVGQDVPLELIPSWITQDYAAKKHPLPGPVPSQPGNGEIWLDAQFHSIDGKEKPGSIIVIDAQTWKVKNIIDDKRLNNPHNMWLSDDGDSIYQTNWFDSYLSIIDRYSKLVLKHIYVGESPAHVITANGIIYVTLQGVDGIAVLDPVTYAITDTIKTVEGAHAHGDVSSGAGPHGHWANANGTRIAVANTEGGSIAVWDTQTHTKIFEEDIGPIALMAGISSDGNYAWATSYAIGRFRAFDLQTKKPVADFIIGKGPVQSIPSPDGKYILVALSGDNAVAIIDAKTFELIKTLPSGSGAHGVYYGPKQNGGTYAYVSNKFVPWITVIDMDALDVAGYIPVPDDAFGGQGILVVY